MATLAARHASLLALGVAATLLINAGRAEAAGPYWRCEMDRVTVIANGSANRCGVLLRATVRYEQLLTELVRWDAETIFKPLRLYSLTRGDAREVMYTEKELAERTFPGIRSKYLPDSDSNVATIVDVGGDDPLQSVLFLYGQSLLSNGPMRTYPAWYRLGIANLLNGLVLRPDGTAVLNRSPRFAAVVGTNDRASERLDLPALLDAKHARTPADFNELARRSHVWAQFGLLTTEEHRRQYRELAILMRQGTPAAEAVQTVFGSSLAELTDQFERGAWRKDVSYRIPAPMDAADVAPAIEMDAASVDAQLKALRDLVVEIGDI
ncbi:MAG TPA: hypothetical protein VH814_15450 [Steroidobacteraceae bacterium]|jgi:hypothetical protein